MATSTRDEKVMVRMTAAEKKLMLRAAKEDDRSLSDWIRRACINAAEFAAEERGNGK